MSLTEAARAVLEVLDGLVSIDSWNHDNDHSARREFEGVAIQARDVAVALRAALAKEESAPKLKDLLDGHTPEMNHGEAWPDAPLPPTTRSPER